MMDRARPTVLGIVLCAIYAALLGSFVVVAAFGTFHAGRADGGLAAESILGLPAGVVAGFGLIGGAFLLAALYALLSRDAGSGGADA